MLLLNSTVLSNSSPCRVFSAVWQPTAFRPLSSSIFRMSFAATLLKSGKLDAFVPQLRNGCEGTRHVATQIRTDRIELQRDGNFLPAIVLRSKEQARSPAAATAAAAAHFEESPSGHGAVMVVVLSIRLPGVLADVFEHLAAGNPC